MPSPAGTLRVLQNAQGVEGADIDLLLIPGISTPSVDTWAFASPKWISKVLPENLKRARILAFDYTASLSDAEFSCQDFLVQGDVLLEALSDARSQSGTRPLFSICHSVGGLILKQALCIANEQPYHYGSVLSSVAGVIFLGTPHKGPTEAETLSKLLTILIGTSNLKKLINIPEQQIDQEKAMLRLLASRFEDINIRAPILTVSETKKTRLNKGFLKSKSLLLTDKSFCTVDSPLEKFLSLPLDHSMLCRIELVDDSSQKQLHQFISETLSEAEAIISAKLEALEFKYATTSTYSPIESEILLIPPATPSGKTPDLSGVAAAGSSDPDFEIVPHLQEKCQRHTAINLPCILLESNDPSRIFFGRQDVLGAIRDALIPFNRNKGPDMELRQFALCGLGGVGKTEIAREFALRYKDSFDAIFWSTADEPAKLDESFQNISVELGLETKEEAQSQVVSRAIVKGWLANPVKEDLGGNDDIKSISSADNDASWLIIFDNADDPKVLGDYWPEGSGSVLITSRDPLAKRLFSTRSSGIDLESLSDVDGGDLLLKLTESDESPEEDAEATAQSISHSLAGLPLAISQMAGIIRRQDLSLSEFLATYEDSHERAALYGMKFDASAKAYKYNVATVWAFEKLSPEAKGLLKVISCLDPDTIQEDILFDAAAMLADVSLTKFMFNNARTELSQSSLIKRDKGRNELSEYRISVHRLVQDAVLAKMSNEEMNSIFGILVGLLWRDWPSAMGTPTKPSPILEHKVSGQRYQVKRYPICVALYPHVIRLKQLWPSISDSSTATKMQFAALLNDSAWYQNERGRTRDFEGFWTLAQELCKAVPGDEADAVLSDIHFSLGLNASVTNDHTGSREHKEAFLALQKSICESIAPDYVDDRLGLAYAELGVGFIEVDQLDEAIEAFRQERLIRDRLGIKIPLSRDANLALAHMMRGELDRAEKLLEDNLELSELTQSANTTLRTGRILYTLANLRTLQGRDDESYQLHLKAFQSYVDTLSVREAAVTRHKLAEHNIRMGRYEDAITMINAALQNWSYDAEIYRPEIARTTFLKAKLLEKLGKTQKANIAYKVAARLRAEILPHDKRDVRSLSTEDFDLLVTFWYR